MWNLDLGPDDTFAFGDWEVGSGAGFAEAAGFAGIAVKGNGWSVMDVARWGLLDMTVVAEGMPHLERNCLGKRLYDAVQTQDHFNKAEALGSWSDTRGELIVHARNQ